MVSSQFGALLKEFESFFDFPLNPDDNNSCLIQLVSGVAIQIEMDRYGMILLGSRLGAVLMGRYRDNLIRQALKSNEATLPSSGVIGFSIKSNQFILFAKLNPLSLNSNQIVNALPPFIAKATLWKESIGKGEIPEITPTTTSNESSGGMFGLVS